jgi:uncharacterized protein YigA (DUF484 family)
VTSNDSNGGGGSGTGSGGASAIQGITEDDIANYLANTPGFFERHSELLASVQLASPHSHRAVSLQQRQMEMLRERIKGLERRIMDMIRHSQENSSIADRLHEWTRALMLVADSMALPGVLVDELSEQFLIPQAAIRVWGVAPAFAEAGFATGVNADMRSFASSLTLPYCGANVGFDVAHWLETPQQVASMAMIPLRGLGASPAFGLLVLGSPDPTRYAADMGTDFLVLIGDIASAALSRLLPDVI